MWSDMSEYVVHFTKDHGGRSAYQNMLSILGSGELRPGGAFGAARGLGVIGNSQHCVCLSEVPIGFHKRLVDRRSQYGIAFTQEFLSDRGGARVWYVDKGTSTQAAFLALKDQKLQDIDQEDPFWRVTPFVDFPGGYGGTLYRFEWEREWRVPGELNFNPVDVRFLFIPEEQHKAAREFFAEAEADNTGPNYPCPFLDPLWSVDQVAEALAEHDQTEPAGPEADDVCQVELLFSGDICPACGEFHS